MYFFHWYKLILSILFYSQKDSDGYPFITQADVERLFEDFMPDDPVEKSRYIQKAREAKADKNLKRRKT